MNIFQIIIITIQTMSLVMMFFFGWLRTKMELPDGIINWWLWLNMICLVLVYIAEPFGRKIKIKDE